MKIQTMSIVVGTTACNARCPFCVSKTTPENTKTSPDDVNWGNFNKAVMCAEKSGVQTVLLTGKGEPTLYPSQISSYLNKVGDKFPFIELQTNGILLQQKPEKYDEYLKRWHEKGLNTIAISVVHYLDAKNKEVYTPENGREYMNLSHLVDKLHRMGFTVRLCCMMLNGYIDSASKLLGMINFCKINKIKQFTARPIAAPENNTNDVTQWIHTHTLDRHKIVAVDRFFEDNGTQIMRLAHGAIVYDVDGQNVCWSNCLTDSTNPEDIRQLIFFPDGTLAWDWKYKGATLL